MLWNVGIGAAIVVAALAWWWVPKWQMRSITVGDPKARADIEDNFRKTIGQLLGGAAVLIGAGLAYDQTQRTLAASDTGTITSQQVSKGFEQLASDKAVMRLGASMRLRA